MKKRASVLGFTSEMPQLMLALLLTVSVVFWCGEVRAEGCTEVDEAAVADSFVVDEVVFADEEAAPINGVVAVRLRYGQFEAWPDEATVLEQVNVTLTRDEDEVVEGDLEVDRQLEEVRFVSARLLAEGIVYTVSVDIGGELTTAQFRTGRELDEAAPAFSGLQRLEMTEKMSAVESCCDADEVCMCEGCQWCWVVDWKYTPAVTLSWGVSEDEFGYRTVSYLVERVDENGAPLEEPRVVRVSSGMEMSETVEVDASDPGPFCFKVKARDIFGREVDPGGVQCGRLNEIVALPREAVPQPDRAGCQPEPGEDTGVVGEDTGVMGEDAGVVGEDAGMGGDAGSAPNVSLDRRDDDGCGCVQVAGRRGGVGGGALLLLMLAVCFRRSASRRGRP